MVGNQSIFDCFIFIRHSEHGHGDLEGAYGTGLTRQGIAESRSMHNRLPADSDCAEAYSMDNLRALGTITLALYPELPDEDVAARMHSLISEGRIHVLPYLSYRRVEDPEFEERLTVAYKGGKSLSFLVHESDNYLEQSGQDISSRSVMALDVAQIILGHINNQGSPVRSDELHKYKLYCGREFVYACFRAELTNEMLGTEQMDAYVDWYGAEIELNDAARIATMRIDASVDEKGSIGLCLTDAYDQLHFDLNDLICMENRLKAWYEHATGNAGAVI